MPASVPLFDDRADSASAVTRDYVLEVDAPQGKPPCCRCSAARSPPIATWPDQAMNRLGQFFPDAGPSWTRERRPARRRPA
ncbi:hypothetical protein ACRAWD_29915 [Caulobacter segnis]